jgi:crossover junction endodeoxyribonuclease RuvC
MKVLSIDPGYGRCGVAILDRVQGKKETLVYSACIETSAKIAFIERLAQVITECERIITTHSPDHVALERLYFSTNQKTAMQVSEVRGALINMASRHGLPVHEYTPAQVKSAAAGWGGADKRQVAIMVRALIQMNSIPQHDDEYDAIAVGITHFAHVRG